MLKSVELTFHYERLNVWKNQSYPHKHFLIWRNLFNDFENVSFETGSIDGTTYCSSLLQWNQTIERPNDVLVWVWVCVYECVALNYAIGEAVRLSTYTLKRRQLHEQNYRVGHQYLYANARRIELPKLCYAFELKRFVNNSSFFESAVRVLRSLCSFFANHSIFLKEPNSTNLFTRIKWVHLFNLLFIFSFFLILSIYRFQVIYFTFDFEEEFYRKKKLLWNLLRIIQCGVSRYAVSRFLSLFILYTYINGMFPFHGRHSISITIQMLLD